MKLPSQRRRPSGAPKRRPGGTRKWDVESKKFARGKTCWLQLPGCTIRATGVDHYFPVSTHPWLEWAIENWRPACRHCNSARRDTPAAFIPRLRSKMERDPKYRKAGTPRALGFFS